MPARTSLASMTLCALLPSACASTQMDEGWASSLVVVPEAARPAVESQAMGRATAMTPLVLVDATLRCGNVDEESLAWMRGALVCPKFEVDLMDADLLQDLTVSVSEQVLGSCQEDPRIRDSILLARGAELDQMATAMLERNARKDFTQVWSIVDLESVVGFLLEDAIARGECTGSTALGRRSAFTKPDRFDLTQMSTIALGNTYRSTLEWSGRREEHPVIILRTFVPLLIEQVTVEATIEGDGRLLFDQFRPEHGERVVEPIHYSGEFDVVLRVRGTGRCLPLGYEVSAEFELLLAGTRYCMVTAR